MDALKRSVVTHNVTKVRALLFLQMRKRAGYETTTAREIAIAIQGNARSLYVLLERWTRWGLVIRYAESPFSYCLDTEGERYLSKIGNWFFSGYYSRKRKRRVLGYRGKAETLRLEIATAAKAAFYTYDTKRKELLYFEAPFTKAAHFIREPIIGNQHKKWPVDRLLLVGFESISDAYNAVTNKWGLPECKVVGQAMVDAGIGVSWVQPEKQ